MVEFKVRESIGARVRASEWVRVSVRVMIMVRAGAREKVGVRERNGVMGGFGVRVWVRVKKEGWVGIRRRGLWWVEYKRCMGRVCG